MFVNLISKGGKGDEKLSEEEVVELTQVQASAFLNMSVCYYMLKDYPKSRDRATSSLQLQKSTKGFYRRAVAKKMMTDYDGACEDLKEAIKLDTSDPNDF